MHSPGALVTRCYSQTRQPPNMASRCSAGLFRLWRQTFAACSAALSSSPGSASASPLSCDFWLRVHASREALCRFVGVSSARVRRSDWNLFSSLCFCCDSLKSASKGCRPCCVCQSSFLRKSFGAPDLSPVQEVLTNVFSFNLNFASQGCLCFGAPSWSVLQTRSI
jgi:hypothetical protein